MEIKEIKIEKLFGFLNHNIPLFEEGISILHGPNGCGKTTILRLLNAIFSNNLRTIANTDFKYVTISLKNNQKFIIERKSKTKNDPFNNESTNITSITFKLKSKNRVTHKHTPKIIDSDLKRRKFHPAYYIERLPFLKRISDSLWFDERTGEKLTYNAIRNLYGNYFHMDYEEIVPEWIEKIFTQINIYFIQTQRLLKLSNDDTHKTPNAVDVYSSELANLISKKLAESAAISQSKDQSFPERLLKKKFPKEVTEVELRKKYAEAEERIRNLMNTGLLDEEKNISLPKQKFEEVEKRVLSLYLQDINEKLDLYNDLQEKITLFLDIIRNKLNDKTLTVDRRKGMVFETKYTNKELNPSDLSSGEQHQIVLFYELIFKSKLNSIYLIDEPEISLHVAWQRQFLNDLLKISKLFNHNFIIATHSPQIINNRRDIAIGLSGGIL